MEVGGSKSVVFCGRSTYKLFMCFDRCPPFHGDSEESQYKAVLNQALFICGFGTGRPGAGQTLAAHPHRALVAGLGALDYGCEDRYAGDGAAACGHRSGAWRKSDH